MTSTKCKQISKVLLGTPRLRGSQYNGPVKMSLVCGLSWPNANGAHMFVQRLKNNYIRVIVIITQNSYYKTPYVSDESYGQMVFVGGHAAKYYRPHVLSVQFVCVYVCM